MAEAIRSSAAGKDVLHLLNDASDQLRVGELLAPESFSLAAVMNATEIGNPRLDAGELPEFLKSFPLNQTCLVVPVVHITCLATPASPTKYSTACHGRRSK